jgi:hypothetical protein
MWDAVLSYLRAVPGAWEHVNARKAVLPRIYRTLRGGGRHAMPCALPLLSCIPAADLADVQAELLYTDYLEALWEAVDAGGMTMGISFVVARSFVGVAALCSAVRPSPSCPARPSCLGATLHLRRPDAVAGDGPGAVGVGLSLAAFLDCVVFIAVCQWHINVSRALLYRSCAKALQTRVGGASGDAAVAMLGNRMVALLSAPTPPRARVARVMWGEAPARLRGLAECGRCPEAWAAVRAAAAPITIPIPIGCSVLFRRSGCLDQCFACPQPMQLMGAVRQAAVEGGAQCGPMVARLLAHVDASGVCPAHPMWDAGCRGGGPGVEAELVWCSPPQCSSQLQP